MQQVKQHDFLIAQVCFTHSFGGLEMTPLNYQEQFNSRGYNGVIFCLKNSRIEQAARERGLEPITFDQGKYFNPFISAAIRRTIKERNIKYVFVHHMRDLWLLRLALLGLDDVRVYAIAHMFLKDINKKDFLHRWVYSVLQKIMATTNIQAHGLKLCLPIPDSKYVIIPNAIDTKRFFPSEKNHVLREEWGFQTTDTIVGLVGRIDPWKGQEEFVLAADALLQKHPNLKFVMVGDTTPGQEDFFQKIQSLLNQNDARRKNIKLLPFRKDVENVLRALDIFVMPSWEESFGFILLEAMATGLPCIATRAGGVPDVISEDAIIGKLVEPKNHTSLAEGIRFFLNDMNAAKAIGKRATDSVQKRYSYDVIMKRLLGPEVMGLEK